MKSSIEPVIIGPAISSPQQQQQMQAAMLAVLEKLAK